VKEKKNFMVIHTTEWMKHTDGSIQPMNKFFGIIITSHKMAKILEKNLVFAQDNFGPPVLILAQDGPALI
jgi:hypothetical protein